VIGHGIEDETGMVYCCAHCAGKAGVRGAVDHPRDESTREREEASR
jgi:hypothetical protein